MANTMTFSTTTCTFPIEFPHLYTPLKEGSLKDVADALQHRITNEVPVSDELAQVIDYLHLSPHQAEYLLKLLESSSNDGQTIRPTEHHYQQVLCAWRDLPSPSAKRAQALLEWMEAELTWGCPMEMYNIVLETWARAENAEGAQALMDRMLQDPSVTVARESFGWVLEAWSKSKSQKSAQRAESILLEMKLRSLEPTAMSYLRVMDCWAKSRRKGLEIKLEDLFLRVQQFYKNSSSSMDPNILYAAALHVLRAYHSLANAHRGEEFLLDFTDTFRHDKHFTPTLEMCLSVLSTWSKSNSSRRAARAEKLLSLMEKDDALPNPDTSCYTAVLHCWAGSSKPNAAERAEVLLRLMECNDDTRPNTYSYTCVLNAWSQSRDVDAPLHAERLVAEMKERQLQIDRRVYTALITTWGRSRLSESIAEARRNMENLQSLYKEHRDNAYKPTTVEYTALIQAWAHYVSWNIDRSREAADTVSTLLQTMTDSNDEDIQPNAMTFAAALRVLVAARRIPDRGDRAHAIVRRMWAMGIEVTPHIENLVRKCSPKARKEENDSEQNG